MPDIDAFIDGLWLEEGLSKNTLAAYRRDLELFAHWLGEHGRKLIEATETDLNAYFAARHAASRATTANRRLTGFKRYFRRALRERLIQADPTLRLQATKQALRVPKTLTEAQVETLLTAPGDATRLAVRDRTMQVDKAALRIGAVASIHRFGSSLKCVVDGVFEAVTADDTVQPPTLAGVHFHAASGLDDATVAQARATVRRRLLHAFVVRGHIEQWDAKEMLTYKHSGFSVDASVRIEADDRTGLERRFH